MTSDFQDKESSVDGRWCGQHDNVNISDAIGTYPQNGQGGKSSVYVTTNSKNKQKDHYYNSHTKNIEPLAKTVTE